MEGAGRGALLGRWFLFWVAQTSTWATVSRLPVYFVAHAGNGGGGHETDAEHERRRLPRWLLAGGSPESSCGQWFPDPRAWGERERKESEGVPFRRLRAWVTEWKEVRPEQPWLRPWELVGSSAQAGVGNGTVG